LKHYKGEWRGKRIELEPWQCWIISVVFGWKRKDGLRRYREVYEEVARKNGKTIKLAGIGGYLLRMDNEGAPEIYAAATTRDQSKRLWIDARKMLGYAPALKSHLKFKDSESYIGSPSNDGFFVPLSRLAEAIDGSNPHGALVDELHAHSTPEIYDVLMSGMGARSQPLLWAITTAGAARPKEESICLQKREYACNVLEGKFTDDNFFAIIYTLDDDDDWRNPQVWIKANPNLEYTIGYKPDGKPITRGSVKYSYLESEVAKACNSPIFRYGVLTKNFNRWMSNAFAWLVIEKWDACARVYRLEDLADAVEVYGGLDLASVSDLTSLTLLAIMPNGEKRIWSRSWIPEERIIPAVQERQVPYDQWVEQGWLIATAGNVTNYNFITADLVGHYVDGVCTQLGLFELLPIRVIAYDDWAINQFLKDLDDVWHSKFRGMRQGYKSMSPAMKETERLYLSGGLVHDGNPVLRWAMSNVVAVVDPSENVKPDKKKSSEKIDPAVSLMMAVGASMANLDDAAESAYADSVYI
jgi:phage terminase large subunit-like protein